MAETSQKKSSIDEQTKYVARWLLAVLLFTTGLSQVNGNGGSALFISLGGILICPPVVDKINEILKGKFGFAAQFGTVVVASIILITYLPSAPKEETFTAEQVQQIVDEALSEQEKEFEETTIPEKTPEELEKEQEVRGLETKINGLEAEISTLEGYIETFDSPFEEYQRINEMYFAAGNMNANKDQFFINVWQGEINELEVELNSLEAQLQALQ